MQNETQGLPMFPGMPTDQVSTAGSWTCEKPMTMRLGHAVTTAPTVCGIRRMRAYLAEHPECRLTCRPGPPLLVDRDAPLRLQQAQVLERLAYFFSTSASEFLTWRDVFGLTTYFGEPTLSERTVHEIDLVELELER